MSDEVSKLLQAPFAADEVEWRIGQSGKTRDGKVWAKAFAYITNRAIQNRLDAVFGPYGWQCKFEPIEGGFLCGIGVQVAGEWVWKWDGAERTDFEPLKGGISGSMKRAAVQWGMGRYLYGLEEGWCEVSQDRQPGYEYAKTKEGDPFYWLPPRLPSWALPGGSPTQHDTQPAHGPPSAAAGPPGPSESKPRQSSLGACPKCGSTTAVIVGKKEYGGGLVCYKAKQGCGHKWQPGDESFPPEDPFGNPPLKEGSSAQEIAAATGMKTGSQLKGEKKKAEKDNLTGWAELLLGAADDDTGAKRAAFINAVGKNYKSGSLTVEHVADILNRAMELAQTKKHIDLIESCMMPFKEMTSMPEALWLPWGELIASSEDRVDQAVNAVLAEGAENQ